MADLPIGTTASETHVGTAHPLYATWAPIWRKLAHVYEGSGGFLDGGYIQPHPREWEDHSTPQTKLENGESVTTGFAVNPNPVKPTAKLKERRRLARYENVGGAIVDQKVKALFRQPPVRMVKGGGTHPWLDWCDNVDGYETCLTDYLHDAEIVAQVFGHAVIMLDRPYSEATPITRADLQQPYLRCYTPIDMPDWANDDAGRLTAVKLLEAIPRTNLKQPAQTGVARVRIVDDQQWELLDESKTPTGRVKMKSVRTGAHGLGKLPVVLLYSQKRALIQVLGKPTLNDPQLYIDLYNLTSELRELLRKQTFALLNIPLGTGQDQMDVEVAKRLLGNAVGTVNVLFSGLAAAYISPSGENVVSYQTEIARLLRTIYRLTFMPWEADSKDAEAEGSLKLKREDLNLNLSGHADHLERAEYEMAELWFRAEYGAEKWQDEWAKVEPAINYPRNFDATPFQEMLEQAQAALALPLGQSKTFLLELCKLLLPIFLPNLAESALTAIIAELEKIPDPQEQKAAALEQMAVAFAGTPKAGAKAAAADEAGADPAADNPQPPVAQAA